MAREVSTFLLHNSDGCAVFVESLLEHVVRHVELMLARGIHCVKADICDGERERSSRAEADGCVHAQGM